MTRKTPGDRAALGDTLGHPQEPEIRWARLVGFCHTCPPIEQIIIRLYANPKERWPSGEYRTTSPIFMCAWEGP